MSQLTMGERLKFLLSALNLKVGQFARTMGVSDTNIRNYLERGSKPGADFLENLVRNFDTINPGWLLTGEGEPFKEGSNTSQNQTNISGRKNNVAVAGNNSGKTIQNNYHLADCEKERDDYKAKLEHAQREIELLTGQVEMQKTIIAGKDQMLDLLRGGFNRPN